MIQGILHVFGVDNLSGPWYGFWSGFGSDLTEVTGLGLVAYAFWRKHNCHVKGCWRVGWHQAGDHVVCARHHPKGAPTHAEVLKDA